MGGDYYPLVQHRAIPSGEFFFYPKGGSIAPMQTIHETRRQRLGLLVEKHGSIAKLNDALKWPRTDSRISRIRNANARTDRDGKVFQMGDAMAREIEATLSLEPGWMDTPPTYAELNGEADPISKALGILRAMEPELRYQAVRLLDALAEPHEPNGSPSH